MMLRPDKTRKPSRLAGQRPFAKQLSGLLNVVAEQDFPGIGERRMILPVDVSGRVFTRQTSV